MKVYVVEGDLTGMDAVQKCDALGKAIGALAKFVNEPVFFHEYIGPVCGAPVILLECSDGFLGRVRKLPGFKEVHEISPSAPATERSSKIWSYFTSTPLEYSRDRGAPKPPKMM